MAQTTPLSSGSPSACGGRPIQPWLDRWSLTPGESWQEEIVQGLRACRACAVFVGPHGLGDWARQELAVAQDRAAKDRDFRLFMVLLPGALKPVDPSLAFLATRTWVDLREGADNPRAFQDLVSAITGVALDLPTTDGAPGDDVCPYRGLEAFDAAHAEFFFGRSHAVVRVIEKLKGSRFLAVLGPSGCGKSSLVRAGVVPALARGALPGSQAWTVRVITPGARPLRVLAAQLARLFPEESMQRTLEGLRADEQSLDLAVSLALAEQPGDERLVLAVDQFEEVFTLCADEDERAAFVANLCYAASIPGGRLVALVAVRADFYHRCAPYPQLAALMADQQFLVSPLGPDGLREVIERPAWRAKLQLEAGLVETILGDVADRPGTLPLLEYVLLEVWRHRRGRMLTLEAYVASGGVEGALAQRADSIYQGLAPAQQAIARRVLLRLIQPGEGTEDTRCRATMAELLTRPEDEADLEAVVKDLADARLLTTGCDEPTGARVVDVAHEALIRDWPKLRGWIDEDREALRAHRRLTEAAGEWDANGREEGLLYRGARLAAWQDRPVEDLNDLERAFLAASREREERERGARRRRVRLALISLSIALAVISGLALQAVEQRQLAVSRELAASARTQLSIDPELSLLLAREAFGARPTVEAESVLRQATLDSRIRATLQGRQGQVYSVAFHPDGQRLASAGQDGTVWIWDLAGRAQPVVLRSHRGPVNSVAFSADGQRLASGGDDGTVRMWDLAGGTEVAVLRGHQDSVRGVALSPDGQRLASVGDDGTVRIWDSAGGTELAVLRGHQQGEVFSVAFSPDGQRLASAGRDGTVWIWDPTGTAGPVVLHAHPSRAWAVAFSPDGKRLAITVDTVQVWDWAARTQLVEFPGHQDRILGVAFSPDGQRVASAGDDGTVRLWDLTGRAGRVVLRGHQGSVWSVAFSPDGQRLASASSDGTVRIWDPASEAGSVVLHGRQGVIFGVALSPDSERLANAGADGTVQLWSSTGKGEPAVVAGHQDQVYDVAFSPDGQRLASASWDGAVRIWNLTSRAEPVILRGHQRRVYSVAFSPDGQFVASTGGDDGTVRMWDSVAGTEFAVLRGHKQGGVFSVAFSPDGQRLASAGRDGTVRIWDPTGTARPVALHGHHGEVYAVAFSPDGRRLASTSGDGTIRIWNPTGRGNPVVLPGHQGKVHSVAFSPDGRLVASAGVDGTVRIWDLTRRGDPIVLRGHEGRVRDVAFGQRVASAGDDGTVRVWDCEVCGRPIGEVLALAEGRVTRELTCEERQTFLHEPCRS